jgi:hypothetical protein
VPGKECERNSVVEFSGAAKKKQNKAASGEEKLEHSK